MVGGVRLQLGWESEGAGEGVVDAARTFLPGIAENDTIPFWGLLRVVARAFEWKIFGSCSRRAMHSFASNGI